MMAFTPFRGLALGAYGLIEVDPPWAFKARSARGLEKSPQRHYGCMSVEEIAALPVGALAAPDCWLALWTTNPFLPRAFEVLDAWGFSYASKREWVKRGESGKLAFGTGYLFRGSSEPILIGRRGAPKICDRSLRTVFEAPRREHSRKPDLFYEEMARFVGPVRKASLFARERRAGWDCFGDELGLMEPCR